MVSISEDTPYIRIGGETNLQELVNRIFELLDNLPEVWELRQSFAEDLTKPKAITYQILQAGFDAPTTSSVGNASRELPLPISERQLNQWHLCLRQALNELQVVEDLQNQVIDILSCCRLPESSQVA